jgi:hypothetical protein
MNTVTLALALFLAFLLEATTEYFIGAPISKAPKLSKYKPLLIYINLVFGVTLALLYKIDIVGFVVPGVDASITGMVLTGIAISRGADFIHRLTSRFIPPKSEAEK